MSDEIHVRARVDLPQHSIDIKGVGAQFDVVALGENDLKDVTRKDVFLRYLDRIKLSTITHRRWNVFVTFTGDWWLDH